MAPQEPVSCRHMVHMQRARFLGREEFENSILYVKALQAQAAFTVVVAILRCGLKVPRCGTSFAVLEYSCLIFLVWRNRREFYLRVCGYCYRLAHLFTPFPRRATLLTSQKFRRWLPDNPAVD